MMSNHPFPLSDCCISIDCMHSPILQIRIICHYYDYIRSLLRRLTIRAVMSLLHSAVLSSTLSSLSYGKASSELVSSHTHFSLEGSWSSSVRSRMNDVPIHAGVSGGRGFSHLVAEGEQGAGSSDDHQQLHGRSGQVEGVTRAAAWSDWALNVTHIQMFFVQSASARNLVTSLLVVSDCECEKFWGGKWKSEKNKK